MGQKSVNRRNTPNRDLSLLFNNTVYVQMCLHPTHAVISQQSGGFTSLNCGCIYPQLFTFVCTNSYKGYIDWKAII